MNLEEMLEDIQTVGGTLAGVEASTDITVEKEETPVAAVLSEERSIKDKIIDKLSTYDTLVKAEATIATDYDNVYEELLKANPEIADKLKELDLQRDACNSKMELIKKELLPMFQVAVAEDPDNKTLLCNKVQATYVYPTKKHSFDLKDFMEKESSFYFDNISKFAPYAKISDVSDSIKITIKK